jgi:hypothetical protein
VLYALWEISPVPRILALRRLYAEKVFNSILNLPTVLINQHEFRFNDRLQNMVEHSPMFFRADSKQIVVLYCQNIPKVI